MSRAMQFDIVANDKASVTMANVDKSMGKFATGLSSKLSMVAARATAAIAVVQKVAATVNELGNVADEAARLGLSVEVYQKLKFAAEDYGSSIEEIAKAMKDMNKMLDEAATKKTGPAMDTLKALGFSEQDILSRTIKQAEVFERIADAIKSANSEEEKFAIASRVFGDKISQGLVPVLENYREFNAIQAATTTMTQKNADNLDRLGTEFNKFFQFTKAISGEALGAIAGKILPKEPKIAAQTTEETKARSERMKAALLKVGAKEGKVGAQAGEVSSMAAVGGAAFRGFPTPAAKPIEEQQLAELKTIASNTGAVETNVPTPGSTDVTKFPDNPFGGIVDRIRASGFGKRPSGYEELKNRKPAR